MLVLHGLLGSKRNWRSICQQSLICQRRDCYLVELRNHAASDHHSEMDYQVICDDLLRFADKQGLQKFDVLGHSLGGRTAMTMACKHPDRVDGVISVDSAPIDESGNNMFGSFTYSVLQLMHNLSYLNLTREEAGVKIREFFGNKP